MDSIDSDVDKPVISVILTTFNRAAVAKRAIESVLQQTYSAFELLIVDDASTDDTTEVVAGFADARIRYLRQTKNGGVGIARNVGIEHARGEYIVFVDDDDTIAPSFLEVVYRSFSQAPATVGFLWTWKETIRQAETGDTVVKILSYHSETDAPQPGKNLLRKPTGGSGGLVVRAASLRVTGGFNPELRAAGDAELLIRLAKHFDYMIISQPLYRIYRHHSNGLTAPSLMRAKSVERVIELHREVLEQYPGMFRTLYRQCARIYYQIGHRRDGRFTMRQLIRTEPFNWQNWILLMLFEGLDYLPSKLHHRITDNRDH